MRVVATFPLPDGSALQVVSALSEFIVEDLEFPARFRSRTFVDEREACRFADGVANRFRYPSPKRDS